MKSVAFSCPFLLLLSQSSLSLEWPTCKNLQKDFWGPCIPKVQVLLSVHPHFLFISPPGSILCPVLFNSSISGWMKGLVPPQLLTQSRSIGWSPPKAVQPCRRASSGWRGGQERTVRTSARASVGSSTWRGITSVQAGGWPAREQLQRALGVLVNCSWPAVDPGVH